MGQDPGRHGSIKDKILGEAMEKVRDRLLNVEQIRKRLSCSRRHVYNLIEKGDLPAFKIGTRQGLRVKESKVELFLDGRIMDCHGENGQN